MKQPAERVRIGEILLRAGLIDSEGLEKALERQRHLPGRLGTHLLRLGLVSEDDLAKALSIQHKVPAFLPSLAAIDSAAIERLPRGLALRFKIVAVSWTAGRGLLQVAAVEPGDLAATDEVRFATGARRVSVEVAPEAVIERLLARYYGGVEEVEPLVAPEVTLAAPVTGVPGSSPRPQARRGRGFVIDPDPRRRRAVASLIEASGFEASRTGSTREAHELLARGEWSTVWIHRSVAEEVQHPAGHTYDDPVRMLETAAEEEPLAAEALDLAEEAGHRLLGEGFSRARQTVRLVQFLAGRQGLGRMETDRLLLRAWRAVFSGWTTAPGASPIRGGDILAAVSVYERALLGGATPAAAAEAVRTDTALSPGAVTSLLRWAVGANLLGRMDAQRRVLAIFSESDAPQPLLSHLTEAGWAVERSEGNPMDGSWDAVLAALEPGLSLLERLSDAPAGARPPLFLVTPGRSEPDTMYALRLGAEDVFAPDTHPEVVETKLGRAAARWRPDRGCVAGNLRDMGLAELLQVLAHGLKTAHIRIDRSRGTAEIALREGQIVDARSGSLEGEEALYEVLAWEEGAFRVEPADQPRAVTIRGSTEGLLMEGFRRLDEARRSPSHAVPELG